MKATIIAMAGALLLVIALTMFKGSDVFWDGVSTSTRQLVKFAPILIVAIFLAGFVETLLPKELVQQWLSDSSGWKGIGLAWLGGILTPGGSIVGLPIIAGLHRAGVGNAVLMTYATSLATLSLLRVPLEAGFYGWRLTGLRVAVSLILPFIAGGLTMLLESLIE